MPTSVQLPSTNLNNIESSSSQANTNLQTLGKWNTTPEHIQQITTNIEKQQQHTQLQPVKEANQQPPRQTHRHHLPPVTRKTVLGPVRQARSGAPASHHLYSSSDLDRTINYKAIYQPVPNSMASYALNGSGQEWLVAKQRIQRPKDHDILTTEPTLAKFYMQQQQQQQQQAFRPITDADIRKQEFIERKIAQEQYRQELEQQIMQQKPVKSFKPKTTLRFEGASEFKTETKTNFKPFRFVTSLNDLDKRAANEKLNMNRKQSFEKEQQQTACCNKGVRPLSSLTAGGQFKEHLQCKPDPISQQRRHLNQIENEQQNGHYHPHYHHASDLELQEMQAYGEQDGQPTNEEQFVDENNNIIEQQRPMMHYQKQQAANQAACCLCDHCREHCLNGVPVTSATNQNQNELNPVLAPLVGVRALQANKQMNRIETAAAQQPTRRKIKIREQQPSPQQQTKIVRSKSTHFQSPDQQQQEPSIPRMNERGKQRPYKNQSHLRFEGDQRFITTNNMMYRDHSMQNLSSHPDEDHLNRGVFAEQMMKNDKKGTITGNMRGRVRNKYRDLFASSEDIFGNRLGQDNRQRQQSSLNPSNRLSVKYKSAANLPQTSEDYESAYYADDQQGENYEYEQYQDEYEPGAYQDDEYQNAYYQDQQLVGEQNGEEEQYDEEADDQVIETTKQKKLIFIPKNQPPPQHFLNPTGFERRKDLNTSNSSYGSQLQCPALNLASDNGNYSYKYSVGGHKYFQKKGSIS